MARQQIVLTPGSADTAPAGGAKINANAILCDTDSATIAGLSGSVGGLATTVASHTTSITGFTQMLAPLYPSGDTSGVTDTANINAAFAVMVSDVTGLNHLVEFATGKFYINSKLVFTFPATGSGDNATPYEFRGHGGTRIIQVTSNTGLLEFQVPVNQFPANIHIIGIQFEAQTQQTSSNTNSIGIGFRSVVNPATNGETMFGISIEKCRFLQLFRGVANSQPSGQFPVWGVNVMHCDFRKLSGAAVWIVSPVSVGQPNINVWNCLCESPSGGGSEAIYRVDGCDNGVFISLESLIVVNVPLFQFTSSGEISIIGCKGEACQYDNVSSGSNPAILFQNSYGTVDSFRLNGVVVGAGTVPSSVISVQNGATGQSVSVNNLSIGVGSGTGTLSIFQGVSVSINSMGAPNILGLGTGPAVVNFMSTAGGILTGKILHFATPPGGGSSDDLGDASYTWAGQSSPGVLIFNTPLTANRTVSLPTGTNNVGANNCWDGAEVTVTRTAAATGASTLTVNATNPSTKVLAAGQWATYAWRLSSQWTEIASGSL